MLMTVVIFMMLVIVANRRVYILPRFQRWNVWLTASGALHLSLKGASWDERLSHVRAPSLRKRDFSKASNHYAAHGLHPGAVVS